MDKFEFHSHGIPFALAGFIMLHHPLFYLHHSSPYNLVVVSIMVRVLIEGQST